MTRYTDTTGATPKNLHFNLEEDQKHTPQGFSTASNNSVPTRDEQGALIWDERMTIPAALDFADASLAPPTENDGDIYVLVDSSAVEAGWDGASENDWVRYDADSSAWFGITPTDGTQCFDKTASEYKVFNGGAWSSLGGGDNFANADLTLTGNRTHDLSGFIAKLDNGQLTIEGAGATFATTALLVQNSSGIQTLKIDDAGGFVVGIGATIGNEDCVAIGTNADAADNSSPTTATGLIAIGPNAIANGSGSVSIGREAESNSQSTALGFSTFAQYNSTAVGYNANASNTGVALGRDADASNTRAISVGAYSESSRFGSIAIGYLAEAKTSGNYQIALGASSQVTSSNSVLISTKGTTQTNSTANTFEVNLDSTTSVFRFGNTVDGWLNTTGSFGFGTITPSASAVVELDSTSKGFLPPRMTTTEKNAIVAPATGLVLFDTTLAKLCVYTGAAWETITSA